MSIFLSFEHISKWAVDRLRRGKTPCLRRTGPRPDPWCEHSLRRVSGQTKRTPSSQRETASVGVYMGFGGGVLVPDSGPSPRRRRSADRLLAGDCHEPDLGSGGSEQPAAEGLAFEAPQPEGQRRDHLQAVQLHPVNDPLRAASAQCLRAVDGPDVGPHGHLEDPEQPGYSRLREPHLSPGRAADRDPLPVDRNRPRENALHRRRHYRSAGRAFISRRMVWSSTLA